MTLPDELPVAGGSPPAPGRRPLGRTGIEVSEVSLGTVELGLEYGLRSPGERTMPSPDEALRVLDRAIGLGVDFIDTARVYGASESLVGRALRGRRDRVVVATKVEPLPPDLTGAALRRRIEASVGVSLAALETDVVDVLQVHSATVDDIRRGEIVGELERLREAGAIRVVGASTYGGDAARAALEDERIGCLQIAYNLLDRGAEDGILETAARRGVGIIARSVLLRGALTPRHDHLAPGLDGLRAAIAELIGVLGDAAALPPAAYRYVLGDPRVTTALVGTARIDELEAALAAARAGALDADLIERIRAIRVTDPDQLQPHRWPSDGLASSGGGARDE